ncbi:unnamed protein product [Discula destructiva]
MRYAATVLSLLSASSISAVNALAIQPRANLWETLPPTASLPTPINNTLSDSNGAKLWLQKYNEEAGGTPVVFIHGGGGYSAYFGDVITKMIAAGKYCIAVDRRGHGRSTFLSTDVWTFDMFANEIHVQLESIGVKTADWVGWSDGAATTYAALQNTAIEATINKAFVFAGFMNPEDTNTTYTNTAIYGNFIARVQTEYAELQPAASFKEFATILTTLESTLPQFTTAGLGKIKGSKVAVAYADHDEAVNLDVPAKLHAAIPGSTLVELTGVSHFAPMQDPTQFTTKLQSFLKA